MIMFSFEPVVALFWYKTQLGVVWAMPCKRKKMNPRLSQKRFIEQNEMSTYDKISLRRETCEL